MRAVSIAVMPEMELLSVYLVVVAILILKPAGLFGKVTA
jgi:branched-chain amino acid transport system permease protein